MNASRARGADRLGRPFSVYLDLIRVSAALVVFASHACKPGIADDVVPYMVQNGIDAVTVFFVLSGFVIYYTAETKDRRFGDYLISRLARLWSVGIPAIALSAVLSHYGAARNFALYDQQITHGVLGSGPLASLVDAYPVLRFVFGATFLNEIWTLSVIQYFNAPYWSISYEFCYYMFFGAIFYFASYARVFLAILVFAVFGPKIFLLFPVWALGALLYRWRPRVPGPLALPCMLGPVAVYLIAYHFRTWEYTWRFDILVPFDLGWSNHYAWQYLLGALVALHLVGFDSLRGNAFILKAERPIRAAASMTLSIYLFHFPILYFVTAVFPRDVPRGARGLAIIAITLLCVAILSTVTEARKNQWQAALRAAVAFVKAMPRLVFRQG